MSQDFELHLCDTDSENTSLLIKNSNNSLFSPDTFIVTFLWGFVASFSLFSALMSCCCGHYGHQNSQFTRVFKHSVYKKSD